MAKLNAPDMEILKTWSSQQGRPFEAVLKKAGVSNPDLGSRASRSRMRSGGAPVVRRKLQKVLLEYERQRDRPTEIGAIMVGLADWQELGAELGELDPGQFLELLAALRACVLVARSNKDATKAFVEGAKK
jgi:hypothetical protein